ncbi:MAG: PorV/PorQ family protein [Endomicrobia bacterium]|nr:PorV/PorQ family protein [Endomicrobiia bacterium]
MQVKKMKFLFIYSLIFLSIYSFSVSYSDFLNINLDIRTAALADILSVYPSPFSSVYGNPANSLGIKGIEFGYIQWIGDVVGNSVIAGYSFGGEEKEQKKVGIGVGYTKLGTEFEDVLTQQSIQYYDSLLSFVVGYRLLKKLNLGVSVRSYIQQLDNISNTALVFDLGSSFIAKKFGVGVVLKNLGTQLSKTKEELPTRIDVGMKFPILHKEEQKINMFMECSSILNNATIYKIASEYIYMDVLFARIGYKFNTDMDKFSLGVGAKLTIPKIKLKTNIDLSYIPFGSLGEVVKISFCAKL